VFDSKIPQKLKNIQTWFGAIIARGIGIRSRINPQTPSGNSIVDEAARYITPSATLQPWERIQIYNQQYWWRLLDILHENLPFVTRLFGYQDFNELLAIPYLEQYPPDDWSLNTLADRFPQWLAENYHENDKQLVHDALLIDIAFNRGFFAEEHPSLKKEDLSTQLLKTPIYLQPAITLFNLPYNLFSFREEILKETDGDHYLSHPLPKLDRTPCSFIIYRDHFLNMRWETLEPQAYLLLSQFEKGATFEEACGQLDADTAEKDLKHWFNTWISTEWLTLVDSRR
jgi:hypothetical protein